ncbi:MAG: hypothetical protein L3J46_00810 [Kangiellaceae bacterium]|nr:hypothetical protein [Kangiellaceae bacterium]
MITLNNQTLEFSFPDLHPEAGTNISFKRTLRVPDDGNDYPLPAGLGNFPIFHVEDFSDNLSNEWLERGGVMIPIYQSEALWINFSSLGAYFDRSTSYPCAIKIGTGKICAVTGNKWNNELSEIKQDYLVSNKQPWLDGYRVDEHTVRQFVAMELGEGYTAEEQITGEATWGGIQIMVIPMKRSYYDQLEVPLTPFPKLTILRHSRNMGIAPGGKIRQKIFEDPHGTDAWDLKHGTRCFIHTVNSEHFKDISGVEPPHTPISRKEYIDKNIPWFEFYSDSKAISGNSKLDKLKSVAQTHLNKHWDVLPDNQSIPFERVMKSIR